MDKNLDYAIQVKRNQKTLFNNLQEMTLQKPLDVYECIEKGHGRHSQWNVSVFSVVGIPEWVKCKRLIEVRKFCLNKKTKQESENIRYYISNCEQEDALFFHQGIRGHWKIENCLHWVKDVFHIEDKNRVKHQNGAINLSVISSIALNLQKININKSIKEAISFCQYNIGYSIDIIRT